VDPGEPPDVYLRVGEPPAVAPPTGTYYSQELHAHATLAAADGAAPGTAALAIGLAPPRTVSPVSEGVWAGDGVTVRPLARRRGAGGKPVRRAPLPVRPYRWHAPAAPARPLATSRWA
jgi:hypothetical protein